MVTRLREDGPAAAGPGEVVCWTCPAVRVRLAAVRRALEDAGLDPKVCRDMLPRNAFARAARQLEEGRIIRPLHDTRDELVFQLTKEEKAGDHFEYSLETRLVLDKHTGRVKCEVAALAERAQALVDDALDTRTGSDVTALVQRLCNTHADLFPLRAHGGVYFVPARHRELVTRLKRFVDAVGGTFRRMTVAAGDADTTSAVSAAVGDGLAALIAAYKAKVAEFDPADADDATVARRSAELVRLRHKLDNYRELLADRSTALNRELAEAAAELRTKAAAAAA